MKELSIEDKAKRYDELKVKAQELTEDGYIDKLALLDLFPELKESDEERIREWLICTLKSLNNSPVQIDGAYEMMLPAIAWLEKQGEQKPAWSEDDEKCLENAIMYCEWARDKAPDLHCYETSEKSINWLKSIKDRVQPQPQQEWSEEDEGMLYGVIETEQYMLDVVDGIKKFDVGNGDIRKACAEELNWLKSLKDRYTWKPSKEQMYYLSWIANVKLGDSVVEQEVSKHLNELLEDLKKLKA